MAGREVKREGHVLADESTQHAFEVLLPRVAGESGGVPSAEAAESRDPVPAPTETLLLIEDEPLVRQLLADVLSRAGYSVLVAEDGDEALAIAEQHAGRIHLLLTDIVLPRTDGPTVARTLRERDPALRILFMSGYSIDRLGHHPTGSTDVLLEKPFPPATLLRRVRQVLQEPAA